MDIEKLITAAKEIDRIVETQEARTKAWQQLVADARNRGIKLSAKDLQTERDAWIEKRKLKQSLQ